MYKLRWSMGEMAVFLPHFYVFPSVLVGKKGDWTREMISRRVYNSINA